MPPINVMSRRLSCVTIVLLFAAAGTPACAADLTVFAAASLKNALDDAETAYAAQGGTTVATSYAASGSLAKQIESGAPADLFISADLDWMDYLQKKNLIRPDTRRNLLGNQLVPVAPTDSKAEVDIRPGFPLAAMLGSGRIAIGDPASVPAGKYGQQALQKLGIWEEVKSRTANAETVRAALVLVSRGEAPFGIVYETDAAADKGVRIVGVFPEDSHPPVVYPIAITADSKSREAPQFLAFLESPEAAPYFQKQGFTVLK